MAEETKEAEAPAKKGKGKLIIIIVAAVLLLGMGGGAGWYFLVKKPADAAAALAAEQAEEKGADDGHDKGKKKVKKKRSSKKAHADGPRVFVTLDQFVVNLHDANLDRYAQVALVLEVDEASVEGEIKAAMPAIRNAILLLISSRSAENLLSLAGKEQLAIDVALATAAILDGEQPPRPTRPAQTPDGHAAQTDAPPRTFDDVDTGPVSAVHFSQFIVQ